MHFMERYAYKQRNNFTGHSVAERFTLENNRMSVDQKIIYDINNGTPYGTLFRGGQKSQLHSNCELCFSRLTIEKKCKSC